jgi:hypothetical protein
MNVKNISLKTIDLLNRIKFPVKIFHKIAREKKNKNNNLALLVYAIRKALLTKESESDSILL